MINRYDLIIIGGGLGGSTLAYALSTAGFKVLVLERTRQFKDRVRGEQLQPLGSRRVKSAWPLRPLDGRLWARVAVVRHLH